MTLQKDAIIETLLADNAAMQEAIVAIEDWMQAEHGYGLDQLHTEVCGDNDHEAFAVINKLLKNRW